MKKADAPQPPFYSIPTGPLAAVRISVSSSDGTLAAVDSSGNLDISNDAVNWSRLLTGGVKDVAVVSVSQIWMVGTDTKLYRMHGNSWDFVSGPGYLFVATASDATVAVVTTTGSILVKTGYDNTNAFTPVPGVGDAARVAIVTQTLLYYIDTAGGVFQTDLTNAGTSVGGECVEISAASDGTVVVSIVATPSAGLPYQLYKKNTVGTYNGKAIPGLVGLTEAVRSVNSGYIINLAGFVVPTTFS